MKKKIVALLQSEPEWGGEFQYASMIMEGMLGLKKWIDLVAICSNRYWRKWCREHDIQVLNVSWYSFTEREKELHIRHPLFSSIYCNYISGLGKILYKENVNAVLCTIPVFVPHLHSKVIVPVHDLMHRYEGRFPEVSNGYKGREFLYESDARYAWCILTDSELGKKQFIESYSDYMSGKQPHIVSLPYVAPKHIVECEEEFVEVPPKYIFYPAQFWKHKNHLNLIRAIRILKDEIPDIHLVLAGSEKNNGKRIKADIADYQLNDYVTIKGFVSNGNIAYLYRHAVGLVMPSYFGPTNIPPLEAMALGCPVAVSNKYAMPEQVGDAGLLFNPDSPEEIAECIRKMWCDDELRQRMIQNGYRKVGKWTQKEFCRKVQNIIKKI